MKPELKAGQVWTFEAGVIIIRSVDDARVTLDETFRGRHFEGITISHRAFYRLVLDEDWILLPNPNDVWRDLCLSKN